LDLAGWCAQVAAQLVVGRSIAKNYSRRRGAPQVDSDSALIKGQTGELAALR